MQRHSLSTYPTNWRKIALTVKTEAAWRCVRCGHIHEPRAGYTLTVHHLDMDPQNCAWWNLCPLCQRCHLQIQAKVVLERMWMLDHSLWFRPYVAGYYAHCMLLELDRQTITTWAEMIIHAAQQGQRLAKSDILLFLMTIYEVDND